MPSRSKAIGLVLLAFSLVLVACDEKPAISGRIPTVLFKTYAGESITIGESQKDLTLLVFWATWCQPCIMEIPALVRLHEKYQGKNFRVLSVNVDDPDGQKVRAISREYGINYPLIVGSETTVKQFGGITALPTSFLITKDGKILEKLQGLRSEEDLEAMILAALAEPG
jgi:thiol-disulfide isomerase/thioredoxin